MVRVVDCHAGVLGSNPGGPKDFPLGITSLVAAVIRERPSRPLGAVAGSPRLWLMPGSLGVRLRLRMSFLVLTHSTA